MLYFGRIFEFKTENYYAIFIRPDPNLFATFLVFFYFSDLIYLYSIEIRSRSDLFCMLDGCERHGGREQNKKIVLCA